MFDALVLPGGGIKGITLLGALHYLSTETDYLKGIKYYSGTSVGAIICILLIIGYTPLEIFSKAHHFKDVLKSNLDNLLHFPVNYGIKSNESIIKIIMDMINTKLRSKKIKTLNELYLHFNKEIMFYITTVNISTQQVVYLNPIDHPDLEIELALRMSCNIPVIFNKIEWNNDLYVDGMVLDGIPVTPILQDKSFINLSKGKNMLRVTKNILVFKLTNDDIKHSNEINIFDYFYRVFSIGTKVLCETQLKSTNEREKCVSFELKSKDYNILQINDSLNDKVNMFDYGYDEIEKLILDYELTQFNEW